MSTPVTLSVAELKHVLREQVADCTQLGIQLNIKYDTLKKLERQSTLKRPVMDCFSDMCEYWLTNTPKESKKWSVVHKAIEQQDNNRLVRQLKASGYGEDREVDLSLKDFMNELDEMAADWDLLGGALGIPMKVIKRIQDSKSLERYMNAMLETWLNAPEEATWEQLQKALIEVGNRRLSETIEDDRKKDLAKQQKLKASKETESSEPKAAKASVSVTDPVSIDKYMCQVFYQRNKANQNIIHATFAFVLSNKSDGLKDHEGKPEGEPGPSCSFDLEADKLEIAPKHQDGWSSTVTQKEVSKSAIDDYTGERKLPTCVLKIKPNSSESTPPKLKMGVELKGSKPAQTMTLELQAVVVSTSAPPATTRPIAH